MLPSNFLTTPAEHARILHLNCSHGSVTVGFKKENTWSQLSMKPREVEAFLSTVQGKADYYVTPNQFHRSRSISNLISIQSCWVDIDHRDLSVLEALPQPSLLIDSGRGYHAYWLIKSIPRSALPRWQAVQKETIKLCRGDPMASDAARVLRLVGTMNSKNGNTCRMIAGNYHQWSFDDLAGEILPLKRDELHSISANRARKKPQKTTSRFSRVTLWEARLKELQALLDHRGNGKLPPGQRDSWLFFACVAMSWISPPTVLRREFETLAQQVAGWSESESHTRMSSVFSRSEAAYKCEKSTWQNENIDMRYRIKSETIIECLGITDSEMMRLNLTHLVHQKWKKDRKKKKDRERLRKKRGSVPREVYLKQVSAKISRANELRALGLKQKEISEKMGISLRSVKVYLARKDK